MAKEKTSPILNFGEVRYGITHFLLGNKGAHMYNGNPKCQKCEKIYKSEKTLSNHKCSYCDRCQKIFSSFQKYIQHRTICDPKQDEPPNKRQRIELKKPNLINNNELSTLHSRSHDTEVLDPVKNPNDHHPQPIDTPHRIIKFSPVDFNWQFQKCSALGLTLTNGHSFQQQKINGAPKLLKKITADGNCFFRAISFLLTGNESHHYLFRQKLVYHMLNIPEFMKKVLNGDVYNYVRLSNMTGNSVWATENEIYATSHLLKTVIYVYGKYGTDVSWKWLKFSPKMFDKTIQLNECSIYLQNTNQDHYDVVIESKDTTSNTFNSASSKMEDKILKEITNQIDLSNTKSILSKHRRMNEDRLISSKRADKKYCCRENNATEKDESDVKNQNTSQDKRKLQNKLHKQEMRMNEQNRKREKQNKKRTMNRNKENLHKKNMRMNEQNREKEKRNKTKTMNRDEEKLHKKYVRRDEKNRREEKKHKGRTMNRQQEKLHKENVRRNEKSKEEEKKHKERTMNRQQEKLHKQEIRLNYQKREEEKRHKIKTVNKEKERQHKKILRTSIDYKIEEKLRRKKDLSFQGMIQIFHKEVEKGPEYLCICCHQLWYRQSVRLPTFPLTVDKGLIEKCTTNIQSANEKTWICHTCFNTMKRNKIPALAIANIGHFPEIPECLKLTNLEERLVAARIPFMQLHQLPRGGQISVHGNVVNVPTNVTSTISLLPRNMSENQTIPLKLKRKLQYGHHFQYETIRPKMCLSAVKWLVQESSLYKEEGITINENWLADSESNTNQTIASDSPSNADVDNKPDNTETNDGVDSDAEWDERKEDDIPAGTMDTMLQPQDILEESREILSLAPGEGNHPMNIFIDKHSEVLSFPSLYAGQPRPDDKPLQIKVNYSDLCKSELRRKDRRVAGNMPNLFFKTKKLQMNHIRQKAMICLRKNRGHANLTAGDLKSKDFVDKMIQHDDGFRVFKELRGSPPYWEKVKNDLFALIRTLDIPTWFASFSSAETRWEHLLQILGKTVDDKIYTSEEVRKFTWAQKSRLIQKDPVSCARHFDHQVQTFLYKVLLNDLHPVGKISDYFYKVEFQMRGSPHIHMLIWLENAPNLEENSKEEVVDFVDQYVTCSKNEEIEQLIGFQQHSHSRTCRKGGKKVCRFDFPQPPLDKTMVLDPLPDDMEQKEKSKHANNWDIVTKYLNESKTTEPVTFDEFLKTIKLSKEDYILAIQSTLKSNKVFLKRSLDEIRVNNYNRHLLKAWRANMDLQYVLDAYSCAMYIVSYITKSQAGMSNLLYSACKEAREGNVDLKKQVYMIGNKFLNNVEISAQEAVYFILQIPLYKASRDVVFVNTSPPEKRVIMLKTHNAILGLENESEDVEATGIITHYSQRPKCIENMCLADYCSKYKRTKTVITDDNDNEDNTTGMDQCTNEQYILKGGYKLKKKKKNAALRYVHFHPDKDREDHFREILLLFRPWRNEQEIIGKSESFEEEYQKSIKCKGNQIKVKMEEYKHNSEVLEKAMKELQDTDETALEDGWDKNAPNVQHIERIDEEEGTKDDDTYPDFIPSENFQHHNECSNDIEVNTAATGPPDVIQHMIPEEEYYKLIRSLNSKQRQIFCHILNMIKTDCIPFHIFMTGGAGVGKSVVVTAIYQAVIRYLNKGPGKNPDDAKVLLGAPTGIAAFLIKGSTIHSLFHIPANQEFSYKPLTSEVLNSYQCKFRHVKLLIIDEISMVGNKLFNYVNRRLQQIIGSTDVFGGISILAVGDLYQLKPVFDGWIFKDLTVDYGALATNLWQEHFYIFELTEVMRQKGDKEFANILNRLRKGQQTNRDIDILKQQMISKDITSEAYPMDLTHIFTTNALVTAHNNAAFMLSPASKQISINAFDTVIGDVLPSIRTRILHSVSKDPAKTMGLQSKLESAIGQRVEICVNVDVDDGLVNGAAGIVMAVTKSQLTLKPEFIWIKFAQQSVGLLNRRKNKSKYLQGIEKDWTPIAIVKRQFKVGRYKNVQVMRQQFPLRPAAAKTAHRCQGSTIESVVVDLSGYAFCHSHYVALSRVTNLKNLHLRELNEKKIAVDKDVTKEIKRLETERRLDLAQYNIIERKSKFKMLFQNVRSLKKHFDDIYTDDNFSATDLNIFVETKLNFRDDNKKFEYPEYVLKRFDSESESGRKPAYGIAVYYRPNLGKIDIHHGTTTDTNGAKVEFILVNIKNKNNLTVVGLYSSPKVSIDHLKSTIKNIFNELESIGSTEIIIVGDFNIDLIKFPTHHIIQFMKEYRQCVFGTTTDYCSLLDHLYTNIDAEKIDVCKLESYFSDHKAIVAYINY